MCTILDCSQTKALLRQLNFHPKRKWGQNFLVNPLLVERSLAWAAVCPDDNVIEVGPGLGILTSGLIRERAIVYAIEKEPVLFKHICQNFAISILCGDALQHPIGLYAFQAPFFKIVANLPYAIASVWMDLILGLPQLPERMVLMVQKEVADRWLAQENSKNFCPLSIKIQSAYRLAEKCTVSKRCFYPQPNVDSVLLSFVKLKQPFIFQSDCKELMRKLFLHRRQQIGRVCADLQSIYADEFSDFLAKNFVPLSQRAENLPIRLWQKFAAKGR